jgi:hypothetical protein
VGGLQGSCVQFQTTPGGAVKGYGSVVGLPRTMNLTSLQGGFAPATEDDIIHLWLRIDRPGLVEEVKIYLVCASGFSPNVVPGQSEALNTDAFVKAFKPSDFTGFVEGLLSADDAAEIRQSTEVIRDYLTAVPDQRTPDAIDAQGGGSNVSPTLDLSGTDVLPATQLPETFAPGRNTWTEFGAIGRPLRRADFTRIGSTTGRGWDTITGIVIVIQTTTNQPVKLACDDWYLTGGYGLDASEPGAQPYDYRYTHYHLDTGDESNPSAEQAEALRLIPMRQRIAVRPASPYVGFGSTRIRQRFYRRGGVLTDDWYYLGQSTSNGGEFVDAIDDLGASAAPTLQIDNYQAVPSQTAAGATVLAQPLPAIWGPVDGALYACGDSLRPGFVYRSKTGRPGSWPPDLAAEVSAPSEELMHGFVLGGQGFVASRRRIFALAQNSSTGQIVPQDTLCLKGFIGRWSYVVGSHGCYFVSNDGIYLFTGSGTPTSISEPIAALWRGRTVNGYPPIDLTQEHTIRLFLDQDVLYFCFAAVGGVRVTFVYALRTGGWSRDVYAASIASVYWDVDNPELPTYFGGATTGVVYAQGGVHDNGAAIVGRYVGPASTAGRPREDKQFADVTVRAGYIPASAVNVGLNIDGIGVLDGGLLTASTRGTIRATVDPGGGVTDHRGRTFQPSVTWTQPTDVARPGELHQVQVQVFPLGEETFRRVGQWEPLGATGAYLTGVAITVDTVHNEQEQPSRETPPNTTRSVLIEYSRGAAISTLGPFEVNSVMGRRTLYLSWSGVRADQVRLIPQDDAPWLLYKLTWLQQPEPPAVLVTDSGDEIHGDTYYTGLDLTVRASSDLSVLIYVDGAFVKSHAIPWVGTETTLVHITLPPGYGHIYRYTITAMSFFGTPAPGPFSVYQHTWILVAQPGEQTTWNEAFTPAGTLGDKWIKGVLLDCDTANKIKQVNLEVDGVVVTSFDVVTTGRQVVAVSFPQVRGRILRLQPTDSYPSRLWAKQWIFDEEPLALTRWETQLLDHQQPSWHTVWDVNLEYRAPAPVLLQVQGFDDANVQLFADDYLLEATLTGNASVEKRKLNLPLRARKALLWKYVFTSSQGFWLYREGSGVTVLGTRGSVGLKPFGNDDLDHNRAMGNASGIAATPNQGQLSAARQE